MYKCCATFAADLSGWKASPKPLSYQWGEYFSKLFMDGKCKASPLCSYCLHSCLPWNSFMDVIFAHFLDSFWFTFQTGPLSLFLKMVIFLSVKERAVGKALWSKLHIVYNNYWILKRFKTARLYSKAISFLGERQIFFFPLTKLMGIIAMSKTYSICLAAKLKKHVIWQLKQ